ncbi:MAG: hypothetical protein F6K63_27710 [Moorea sp. SIO1G6]|uniref:hypothetical protein n=1 Tax=Moorena sp. SIO1G6 TaxID=2607840 RepID=UPI0013BF89B9|nr:hypothetical protein [Moorena sp. SIO1G6]NES85583.1 hypothetical protein [Moorena sp. SIO2B7]NET67967.1 hypothetical protein [Moorena sp. SIO1G6]
MNNNAVIALMTKLELLYSESEDTFLTFQNPTLPVSPRDLSFRLTQSESDLTPQEALNASADFARLVNLIPAYSSIWSSDGRMLWDEYKILLNQALVASQTLTEAQKAELQAARDLLYDKKQVTDVLGTREELIDSPKLAAYKQYQNAYLDAQIEYNEQKLTAENSTDPQVKQDWLLNEPTYKIRVNHAYSDWIAKGYKEEVEEAFADIERLTGNNPQIAWADWKQAFRQSLLTDLNNQDFYETHFWPGDFFQPNSQTQWTTVNLDASEIAALTAKAPDSIRRMISRSGSTTDDSQALDLDISHLSVELTRVEIIRPWFTPSIFRSRCWKWPDAREPLSDGQEPPQGSLLGYTVSMIFARNLDIKLKPNSESNKQIVRKLQVDQPLYMGPLRLQPVNSNIDLQSVSTLKSAHLAPLSLKEATNSNVNRKVQSKTEEKITFDKFPDGTPIPTESFLRGDEFLAKGIRVAGAPETSYCANATVTAVRRAGTYGVQFPFLTSASPGQINRCNTIPIAITFTRPVRQVTLNFAGASVAYTMKAYNIEGRLLGTAKKEAVFRGGTFDVTFSSSDANISRVLFGYQAAITAIKEIRYEPSLKGSEEEPKIEGLQLIAFLCKKLPKSPNPDPRLNYS